MDDVNFISIIDSITTGDAVHFGPEGWVPMIDGGTETTQGMPFLVHGQKVKDTGVSFNSGYNSIFTTGTSNTWTFSTNNQSLAVSGGGGASNAIFYNIDHGKIYKVYLFQFE